MSITLLQKCLDLQRGDAVHTDCFFYCLRSPGYSNPPTLFCLLSAPCHFYVKVYDAILSIHFDNVVGFLCMTYLYAPWPNNQHKVLSIFYVPSPMNTFVQELFAVTNFVMTSAYLTGHALLAAMI